MHVVIVVVRDVQGLVQRVELLLDALGSALSVDQVVDVVHRIELLIDLLEDFLLRECRLA